MGEEPDHSTPVDEKNSLVICDLASFLQKSSDAEEEIQRKDEKLEQCRKDRFCTLRQCLQDELRIGKGRPTLFVNAAIRGDNRVLEHLPWLIDVNLPLHIESP